jgi:hypothetical protein
MRTSSAVNKTAMIEEELDSRLGSLAARTGKSLPIRSNGMTKQLAHEALRAKYNLNSHELSRSLPSVPVSIPW